MDEFDVRATGIFQPCGCNTTYKVSLIEWLVHCKKCKDTFLMEDDIKPSKKDTIIACNNLLVNIKYYRELYYITLAQLETFEKEIGRIYPDYNVDREKLVKHSLIQELLGRIHNCYNSINLSNKKITMLEDLNYKYREDIKTYFTLDKDNTKKLLEKDQQLEFYSQSLKALKEEFKRSSVKNDVFIKYENQIKENKNTIDNLLNKNKNLKKELDLIKKQNQNLKEELENQNNKFKKELEKQNNKFKKEIEKIKKENKVLDNKFIYYKNESDNKNILIKNKNEQTETSMNNLVAKIAQLQKYLYNLQCSYMNLSKTNTHNYHMALNFYDTLVRQRYPNFNSFIEYPNSFTT